MSVEGVDVELGLKSPKEKAPFQSVIRRKDDLYNEDNLNSFGTYAGFNIKRINFPYEKMLTLDTFHSFIGKTFSLCYLFSLSSFSL